MFDLIPQVVDFFNVGLSWFGLMILSVVIPALLGVLIAAIGNRLD